MATGPITAIEDMIVPSLFTEYVQNRTVEKSALIQSRAFVSSERLNRFLQGDGLTISMRNQKDLDNEAENISTDAGDDAYTGGSANSAPKKFGSFTEIAVRLNRNNSWSIADLTEDIAGGRNHDRLDNAIERVSTYWARRMQAAFIAMMTGVVADNTANDGGDYTNDIKGASFVDGVTNFSAEAALDTMLTLGDNQQTLSLLAVHSVVFNRMQKNNLIDFIPDSRGETNIATFLGREVIVDDGLPASGGVYESWLFGEGAVQYGTGTPENPTEVQRKPDAGNGGGQTVVHSRVKWAMHPVGHAYIGTAPEGGPDNTASANMLAAAGSWDRRTPERKQVKFARLVTREA